MNSALHPLRIGGVLYEGFELLDFFGPLEMFGLLGTDAAITTIAEKAGAVRSSGGPSAVADASFADAPPCDVLLIPGGIGNRPLLNDSAYLAEIRRLSEAAPLVFTVCTGSLLLARTGLLDGLRATTNKRVFSQAAGYAPNVNWIARARWVEDGKYLTSSGISAGIDAALAVIAKQRGRQTSLDITKRAEYTWQEDAEHDPFAASVES
jgi:transcriptional regulator GlxA family with amidase domain